MTSPKSDAQVDTISHLETASDQGKNRQDYEEDVKGRDFTVAESELPKGYFTSANFLGSMFAIGASFGCGVGGFGLAAPVLSFINADIGPDPNLSWVALSYLLTNSVGLMLVGRLSDLFGRRWFFIGGNALATIGCIVAAVAPNIPTLIAGETLIGLGAASQLSYAFAVGELVPTTYRFLAQAWVFAWAIPSSGFAPAIAYSFIFQTRVGWRGIFYLLIALNGATTLAWYFFYHPPTFAMKHGKGRKTQFMKDFDYVGTVLFAMGLLLFLMGISWGGAIHPWNSAHVIATIVVGFLCLVGFCFYEAFAPLKEPLLPMRLFKNMPWNITVLLWALGAAVYYALAIIWPSMVAVLYSGGHSVMWAGWVSCVSNSGILFGEFVGAFFKRKTNFQIPVVFILGSVFLAAMAASTPDTPVRAAVFVFLAAAFIGWNEILNSTIATICITDQREIGTATGIAGSARSFISTICSTVYTVILSNRLAKTIPAKVPPSLISAGLPASSVPSFISALTLGTPAAWSAVAGLTPAIQAAGVRAYKEANASAYSTVFLSTIAFCGVGIVCSFWAPNIDHLLGRDVVVQLNQRGKDEIGEKV
ncbi:MFS general substrate transporter [Lindgomyces ingoldianus]|uniref:MFS general substrate transporter n=1 Tax=Lindgomyces ingoldianus TaxID=673940 RepID=A0ACB6R3F9_9PLEO|nr:MFS general substrate transporter [Lindgomyces ingoldianus]KAF2472865.1 MFS general substrate transporter [Lindgomyces ingoldianus]